MPQPPADELYAIRETMRELKRREAELCDGLLSGRLEPEGRDWRCDMVEQTRRVFLRDSLPASILSDPRHWAVTQVPIIKIAPAGQVVRLVATAQVEPPGRRRIARGRTGGPAIIRAEE